jgi:hypothetical protein
MKTLIRLLLSSCNLCLCSGEAQTYPQAGADDRAVPGRRPADIFGRFLAQG